MQSILDNILNCQCPEDIRPSLRDTSYINDYDMPPIEHVILPEETGDRFNWASSQELWDNLRADLIWSNHNKFQSPQTFIESINIRPSWEYMYILKEPTKSIIEFTTYDLEVPQSISMKAYKSFVIYQEKMQFNLKCDFLSSYQNFTNNKDPFGIEFISKFKNGIMDLVVKFPPLEDPVAVYHDWILKKKNYIEIMGSSKELSNIFTISKYKPINPNYVFRDYSDYFASNKTILESTQSNWFLNFLKSIDDLLPHNFPFTNYCSTSFLMLTLVILTGCAAFAWWKLKINCFQFVYTNLIIILSNLAFIQITLFNFNVSNIDSNSLLYQNSLTIAIELFITVVTLIIISISADTTILTGKKRLHAFEYQLLLIWVLFGLIIMVNANDLLVLYFGIECQAIASYVLTGLRTSSSFSTEAALKYLLISGFGTALMLYGISFFYANVNGTNIYNLIETLQDLSKQNLVNTNELGQLDQMPIWLALCFIVIGFVLKIGIAPYHVWMPDVYQGAPALIVSYFAVIPKFILITLIAEIFYNMHASAALFIIMPENSNFAWLMYMFSFTSIFLGGLGAYMQKDLKRFLAYSSIAHVGYMFLTICLFKLPIVLYSYLIHYVLVTTLLFCIITNTKKGLDDSRVLVKMHHLASLKKTNPTLAWLFVIILFSSAGLPPLWGFFPKLEIFMTTVETQHYFLALWIFLGTCITVFVYLKLIKKLLIKNDTGFHMIVKRISKPAANFLSFGTILLSNYILFPEGCVATIILIIKKKLEN